MWRKPREDEASFQRTLRFRTLMITNPLERIISDHFVSESTVIEIFDSQGRLLLSESLESTQKIINFNSNTNFIKEGGMIQNCHFFKNFILNIDETKYYLFHKKRTRKMRVLTF